jgi:hypothetical protein
MDNGDIEQLDKVPVPQFAAASAAVANGRAESTALSAENLAIPTARSTWIRRFFWLDEVIAQASVHSLDSTRPGWNEYKLALEARAAIEEIKELGETKFSALLLARSELLLLIRCHMRRQGVFVPDEAMTLEDFARARQIPLIDGIWNELPGTQREHVEACFGPNAETLLIDQDASWRVALVLTLGQISSALMKPLEREAVEVGRLIARRWLRIGVTVAVMFLSLSTLITWMMDRSGTINLALNRPVITSTQIAGIGSDHRMLVDGDLTNIGFHTDSAPGQFVVIDLGAVKKFDKVVVYNRADCCKERAVPVRLEVSDDGVSYKKLEDRTEVFDVWTAKMLRARGRYVRLRLLQVNPFHLSEVQVY